MIEAINYFVCEVDKTYCLKFYNSKHAELIMKTKITKVSGQ